MTHVTIYVDGAAIPTNPGRGGAGIVLIAEANGRTHVKAFGVYLGDPVTNNAAELLAAIHALKALTRACDVSLISDSQYLVKTMTDNWRRNHNAELWAEIDRLASKHAVTWQWVKGHNGDLYNEMAHYYAEEAAKTMEDVTDAA
jgi:ribonuclease HI